MSEKLFSLEDKTTVVTGANGQLGRQFIKAILDAGGRAVGLDLNADDLFDEAGFERARENQKLRVLECDVTNKGMIDDVLEDIVSSWGVPTGLVNNAALDSPPTAPASENGPFETYPEKSWDKVMEVNAKGPFLMSQAFGGAMAAGSGGSIINVASIYGVVSPDQSLYEYRRKNGETFFKPVAYSASKSSLLNLTRYLAAYWGGRQVRVNTVTFAGVFNNQDQEFLGAYCKKVPLGRMADEAEYNGAVVFLLSDASSYMTGSNMVLDGGFTAI